MSTPRPAKRAKTSADVYCDRVPFLESFDTLNFRQERLLRVGNSVRTAPAERAVEVPAGLWNTTQLWSPPDDPEFALYPNGDSYDAAVEADLMVEETLLEVPKKAKKSKRSRRPHVVWMEENRQEYLDEVLRAAGRGDYRLATQCPDCLARQVPSPACPEYRCEDCLLPDLVCSSCCVKRHRAHPFHRIEKWTGLMFTKTSLKALGLIIQLNHTGSHCDKPIPCHVNMLVLHTNGIHSVALKYCDCTRRIPLHLQLLRRRLYPASHLNIRTCASFDLLRHLHKLSLTTKASMYDFYRALEKMTDGTGLETPKSRYRALFRMSLQWRHLQMLKWAGRGHDPTGVAGTKSGELAVRCPSCPIPGVNLESGWENAPVDMKFLYTMFICMDANFRLKNQLVSNYSQDPGLGIGWAYMVPRKPYENYLLSQTNDEDISTCVGLQALAKANTKFSAGLRYTGVNMAVCGRSEMILPTAVGNLPKGERYASMDYIFASVLQYVLVSLILISYDISCQWFINLFQRMEHRWPEELKPNADVKFVPAIPKLHEPMHLQTDHQVYSLNYIPGVGLSDCECPERVWAPHNALGNSTKSQGPGSRQDTLDDHFNFWNWLKFISMGTTLARRYKAAIADRNIQAEAHRGLTDSLDENLVKDWEKICQAWDDDVFPKKKRNPYQSPTSTLSEAQVKKDLADEEASHLANGGTFPHATTASSFISIGLDLEDAQRRLRRHVKSPFATFTVRKEGSITEQHNSLLSRIRAWESLLPIYIPGLLQYKADHIPSATNTSELPEEAIIWLPSRIPEPYRSKICVHDLSAIEEKLRTAQCTDSLESLRRILRIKSRMVQFKNKNIRGQREGTRSRAVIDRVHERARLAAEKYRAARNAKYCLIGPGDWESRFRTLADGDIRGYQDPNRLRPRAPRRGILEDDQQDLTEGTPPETEDFNLFNDDRSRRDGTGETRRTISWIWMTEKITGGDDQQDIILQVEWAKSRARSHRAREEVMLLKEEMRRVIAFLTWKAEWWKERGVARSGLPAELAEGLGSIAASHIAIQGALASAFQNLWKLSLEGAAEPPKTGETLADGGGNIKNSNNEKDGDDDDDDETDNEAEGGTYDPDSCIPVTPCIP